MKKTKRPQEHKTASQTIAAAEHRAWWRQWWIWAAALAGLFVVYEVYSPALRGAFVFDDRYLPFFSPEVKEDVFSFVGKLRPLLMLSYWIDFHRAGGADPETFHSTNVILHFFTSVIAALIALRLLEWAGVEKRVRGALAIFAGGLFLLHPLETESVAYVASRSELLSVLFYYAAFAAFLWRPGESMTWLRAISILVLFVAAAGTKEHTITLPVLLILADYMWKLGGIRKNGILYGLLGAGAMVGGLYVWRVIRNASTAGFGMKDLSPIQYLFTESRVLWTYLRMFVLPYGQNVDPDIAISNGPFDHGAIVGLIALIGLVVAAWIYRKQFPLAAFGGLMFFLLIAPTSTVVPIKDVQAEHRMYLPFLGLVLVVCEALRRMRFSQVVGIGATVLIVYSVTTYQRNQVWASPMALWQDAAEKSPDKFRPRSQLAFELYNEQRCPEAVKSYEIAAKLGPIDHELLVDWGLALDCAGRQDEAVGKLRQAAMLENTAHVHTQIAFVFAKQKRYPEALEDLAQAEKIDSNFDTIYAYRGAIFEEQGDRAAAMQNYKRALELNSQNQMARDGLARLSR
jgi:hypothetical protein